jgi:integrase
MPLTDARIRNARPRQKPYKLTDGEGMYLEVQPTGARWWRLKFRWAGRERRLSLGVYPTVGLSDARERRREVRAQLAAGLDPSAQRRVERVRVSIEARDTFRAVADEWLAAKGAGWAEEHRNKVVGRLRNYLFPAFGNRPIRNITGPEMVELAQRIAVRSPDTARRVLQVAGAVFRFAIVSHRADTDPSYRLAEMLPPKSQRHFAAVLPRAEVGALLRAIDGYEGGFLTRAALLLTALTFTRPGEIRAAEWAELDLDAGEWRIPAARMKGRREHWVPLSAQAVDLLRQVQGVTGRNRFVFPSLRTGSRPMSENTLTGALRRLGYTGEQMQAHGFRTVASTHLHEMGFITQMVEAQLAHGDPDAVRGAYNRAEWRNDRRAMMQRWADHLDELRRLPPP